MMPVMFVIPTEEFVEQAQVTNWPARLALVGVMFAVIAVVIWGMRRGWVARMRRQEGIPAPDQAPQDPSEDSVPGLYVGTALNGDWLNRVAVHGLGVRSRSQVDWSDSGISIHRQGTTSVWIPAEDVLAVRADRGVAGTVRSKDSVIVITWRLGDSEVDTGFRADDASGHRSVLDGLMVTFPREARA